MATWRAVLPDYEWMLWNFDRFPKEKSQWVCDAFDARKYAFAADYIRLYAVYHYGGFYFDMDVEAVKSFDPLLSLPYVLGWQQGQDNGLEVAAFGAEPHTPWVKDCLDYYGQRTFVKADGSYNLFTMPWMVEAILKHNRLNLCTVRSVDEAATVCKHEGQIAVFPSEYFSPKSYDDGVIYDTANTYSIHHFAGSWKSGVSTGKNQEPLSIRLKTAVFNMMRCIGIEKAMWQLLNLGADREYPYSASVVRSDGTVAVPSAALTHDEMLELKYQENLNC